MSKTITSSTDYLSSGTASVTAMPLTIGCWGYMTSVSNYLRLMMIYASSDTSSFFELALDTSGSTNNIAAVSSNPSFSGQAKASVTPTANTWFNALGVFASTSDTRAYANGGGKGSHSGQTPATTVNTVLFGGRPSDHAQHIGGQYAHAYIYNRALTDTEAAYLGAGGNPNALKNLVNYWKIASSESPVADQVGSNNLTVTGMAAGTTDPDLETTRIGAAIGALTYTTGTAITQIDASAGHLFDDVSAAFTVTLKQLGAATSLTTATAVAQTAIREIPVSSVSGVAAGDYIKVTTGGTPTRVLGVNATTVTILVDKDQTYAASAAIYRLAVTALSVPGLSITSNKLSGTPTAAATYSTCILRATNNNNSALMGDSDVFSMTISGSGGGGGGGGSGSSIMLTAGSYSGGFQGG